MHLGLDDLTFDHQFCMFPVQLQNLFQKRCKASRGYLFPAHVTNTLVEGQDAN